MCSICQERGFKTVISCLYVLHSMVLSSTTYLLSDKSLGF